MQERFGQNSKHNSINSWMLFETLTLLLIFQSIIWWGSSNQYTVVLIIGTILQGCWFQRIYCVGHEASHRKLFPQNNRLNDWIGQFFLWILLVPLPIFRKIHKFHHASNRKDEFTSALDVYVVPKEGSSLHRLKAHLLWYAAIGMGGWFLHSLISILFFLFLPLKTAQKVSLAFTGWTRRDQILSILCFAVPISIHIALVLWKGATLWMTLFAMPLLVFSLVYSLQLYVYHYRTTLGPKTSFHARRLSGPKLLSWWLLNLNEHDTHHQKPYIVWYALPDHAKPLPSEFAQNQNVHTFSQGLIQQLNGPTIIEK